MNNLEMLPGWFHGVRQHLVSFLPLIPQLLWPHSKLLMQCVSLEQPPSPNPHGSNSEQHPGMYFEDSPKCLQFTLLLGRHVPCSSFDLLFSWLKTENNNTFIVGLGVDIVLNSLVWRVKTQKYKFLPFRQWLGHNFLTVLWVQSAYWHTFVRASFNSLFSSIAFSQSSKFVRIIQ